MKLKAILDSLDGLDESLHELYEQDDEGKYRLNVDGIEQHPAVTGLVTNRDRVLEEKRKLQAQIEKYGDVDPEEYGKLKKAQEDAERTRLEKAGEFEKLKAQIVEKHQKELDAAKARSDTLMGQLKELMIDAEATKIITSEEFGGSTTLLMPHVRSRAQVVETDDGRFRTVVLSPDGKTPMVGSNGEGAKLKDLIAEMRENPEYARAFPATGASGSDARETKAGGARRPGTIAWDDQESFGQNLDEIAKGKLEVSAPQGT